VSDFLDRLILKSTGALTGIVPRPASVYEPVHGHINVQSVDRSEVQTETHKPVRLSVFQNNVGEVRNSITGAPVPSHVESRITPDGVADFSPAGDERSTARVKHTDKDDEGIEHVRHRPTVEQGKDNGLLPPERINAVLQERPEAEIPEERKSISVKSARTPVPEMDSVETQEIDRQQPANSILKKFREQIETQSAHRTPALERRGMDQPQASEQSAPRTIKVTIGRIDVRANFEPAPRPQRTDPVRSTMSLDEYLKKRGST